MGWTTTEKPADVREYLANLLTWESGSEVRRPVDLALTRKACYAAQEIIDKSTGEVRTTAVVILLDYYGSELAYKDIGENEGPVLSDCPIRILDRLSRTDNENARQWRARCRQRASKKAPPFGALVRFDKPIAFTDGVNETEFTVVRCGQRKKRFQRQQGGLVKIPREVWRSSAWRLVGSFG